MGRITRAYGGQPAPDARIAALAATQHGVVARQQLLVLLGEDAIDRRLRTGRLHRLHRGVYAVGHPVLTEDARRLAAVMSCGAGAVLSHRSAAALWGLLLGEPERQDVSVPGRAGRARRDVRLHRPRVLGPIDVNAVRGIPATTPRRTLADLRQVADPRTVERAAEQAVVLKLLVEDRPTTTLTRSELEERMLALIRRHGLPPPCCNEPVRGLSGRVYLGDFVWPDHAAVVETDGRATHGTTAAFERDRERDADLTLAGYRVLRFTYMQVMGRELYVAGRLRALLGGALP